MGFSRARLLNAKDVLVACRRNMKRWLFWSLEDDSFGYLVDYLEGKESRDLVRQTAFYQEFKLHMWKTLCSRIQVFNRGSGLIYLYFIDNITCETLEVLCFYNYSFCSWVTSPHSYKQCLLDCLLDSAYCYLGSILLGCR